MSYCVNCGVELEKGLPLCPLCDTPVINPKEPKDEDVKPPYPLNFTVPKSLSKKRECNSAGIEIKQVEDADDFYSHNV